MFEKLDSSILPSSSKFSQGFYEWWILVKMQNDHTTFLL